MSTISVLKVKNLSTYFYTQRGTVRSVNGISFTVAAGRTLCLVGESGCGKSVTALSLLRLIEPPGKIVSGEVWLDGRNLLELPLLELRRVRGKEISLVFQDPMTSLNPVLTIGIQLMETILSHEKVSQAEARCQVLELLSRMGLPDPERLMRSYPFQLSGGMRQRVGLAMALLLHPKVLIADEPTTALDVTVQAQILAELKRLQEDLGMAIILITHDLGVVAAMADEVAVMYAGSIVECGSVMEVFERPAHPYTRALLRSVPCLGKEELVPIEGQPPSLLNLPNNCPFFPRCPESQKECRKERPKLREVAPGHLVACYHLSSGSSGEVRSRWAF